MILRPERLRALVEAHAKESEYPDNDPRYLSVEEMHERIGELHADRGLLLDLVHQAVNTPSISCEALAVLQRQLMDGDPAAQDEQTQRNGREYQAAVKHGLDLAAGALGRLVLRHHPGYCAPEQKR